MVWMVLHISGYMLLHTFVPHLPPSAVYYWNPAFLLGSGLGEILAGL